LLRDDDLKAALAAEATRAQVPADEILERIRRSGARVQTVGSTRRLWYAAAAVLTVAVVAGFLLMSGPLGRQEPVPAAPASPAAADVKPEVQPAGPLQFYESKSWAFRLSFPTPFVGPVIDERGSMVFRSDAFSISVDHRRRQPQVMAEDLLGDLVAATVKESQRFRVAELGMRTANGRKAGLLHVQYISAAAWFDRASYAVTAGNHEYVVACTSEPGSQTPWEQVAPVCAQVLDTLEVGTDQGFISRAQAAEAVRAGLPGDWDVTLATLEEQFPVEGAGLQAVWRIELAAKADGQLTYHVILDAKSGKVYSTENLVTGEKH